MLVKYFGKQKVSDRYLLLLSPNLDWWPFQIVQCYKGRWQIEVMFRTSKQIFELENYSYHIIVRETDNEQTIKKKKEIKLQAIEWHIALSFIGYMWMNWYRKEYTRIGKTQLRDIRKSWIKYFNLLSSKSILSLISSYG